VVFSGVAVNDVVISRGGLARLLAMDLAVDNKKLAYLRADGLIISTPTGSTAYSSSAGGPILHPSLKVYSVTAICPFLTHPLPLVLCAEAELTALILETSATTFVTIDGQELLRLSPEDVLKVKGIPDGILFASFGFADYFGKLQETGFITDSPGGPKNDPRQ
jgi:NAD+ kinase